MKDGVIRAIGALAGLAAGSFLAPQPLMGFRSTVNVVWDGSACQPGTYSMTSTATNLQTGESFQTPSATFALPAGTVGQDFPDLPDGTYQITAELQATDGQSWQSSRQTVTVGSGAPAPAPPNPAPPETGPQPPPSPDPPDTGPPPPSPPTGTPAPVEPPIQGEVPLAFALELLAMFPSDPTGGGGAGVMGISVTALDVDGDGRLDFISVTSGGLVLIWSVSANLDLG